MPENREYELKFALKHSSSEHLLAHPLLQHALPGRDTRQLASTYFDTSDGALHQRRLSLRVRRSGDRVVQTLKGAGRSRVDRDEWELKDGSPSLDVAWLRSTPCGSVFNDAMVAALEPRFTVDVSRTTLPIVFDGAEIEGALDEGVIRAEGLSLKLREFELELKDGSNKKVVDLARRLIRDVPLTLCLPTKAERGYAVIDGTWNEPTKTIPVDLSAVKTLPDAFSDIVQACLHTIYRNMMMIGGAKSDEDAIHKTRIAVRHLRAVLTLFRPALRRKRFRRINVELKWMSDKLGAARDADVFQHSLDDAAAKNDPPDASLVAERMRLSRQDAHRRLRKALEARRSRLLLFDLLVFSMNGVRRNMRKRRAAPYVRARLSEHRDDLVGATRGWSRLSPDDLHDIRKSTKMLRYDLDVLETLPKLGAKRSKLSALNDDLQTLQQTLGDHHDGLALRERLGDIFLHRRPPQGVHRKQWRHVQEVAARLAESMPQDNALLGKARKAVKRVRRNNLF